MDSDPKSIPIRAVKMENAAGKSRGALSQVAHRFETVEREEFDDGWAREDEPLAPFVTHVTEERARSIVQHNDSPDLSFSQTINPYRGCEHGCVYCMAGDTPILMADGSTRELSSLKVGDEIYGTAREGWYRRYVRSRVLAHWSVVKPAYRVSLKDGTTLIAGPDHRFLTERGWKFVTGSQQGDARRPHLTSGNKLMGTGAFSPPVEKGADYRRGYLTGMIRGDALLASYFYDRPGRQHGNQHQFRLALRDNEGLLRTEEYLSSYSIATRRFLFQAAAGARAEMRGIRTHARLDVERIHDIVAWPSERSRQWQAGYLAGIFDAEGSYSDSLRIFNSDRRIIDETVDALRAFGFKIVVEKGSGGTNKPVQVVRVAGGLREHLRFFHTTDPAITRKRSIFGIAVKSHAKLNVTAIEPIGHAMRLFDITTETGDFIANGVVSHNCYARPSHAYLELSPGLDFETKLFAKVNAAELLKKELGKRNYKVSPIALGANTDAYQPIDRKYQLTRRIIEVLSEAEHPFTVVTKSALVERDLDLIAPMAAKNLVRIFVTITTLDRTLARRLEPRAASPQRRLDTVRALSQAGVTTGVMLSPVIPGLNDKSIEEVVEAAAAAGASSVSYTMLRLAHELKPLFREWLEAHVPLRAAHVMSLVQDVRGGKDNDPRFGIRMRGLGNYAELTARRFEIARRRHGLGGDGRGGGTSHVLDCTRFRAPAPPVDSGPQLDLF